MFPHRSPSLNRNLQQARDDAKDFAIVRKQLDDIIGRHERVGDFRRYLVGKERIPERDALCEFLDQVLKKVGLDLNPATTPKGENNSSRKIFDVQRLHHSPRSERRRRLRGLGLVCLRQFAKFFPEIVIRFFPSHHFDQARPNLLRSIPDFAGDLD